MKIVFLLEKSKCSLRNPHFYCYIELFGTIALKAISLSRGNRLKFAKEVYSTTEYNLNKYFQCFAKNRNEII